MSRLRHQGFGGNNLELLDLLLVEVRHELAHHGHVVDHDGVGGGHAGLPGAGEHLVGADVELHGPLHQDVESGLKLKTVLEQTDSGKHVESQPGSGHGNYQPVFQRSVQ